MVLERDAVDRRLDRRVEQLGDEDQEQAADEQRALEAAVAEPEADRRGRREDDQLLPERILVARRRGQAFQGVPGCVQKTLKSGLPLVRTFFRQLGVASVNSSSS
jgi:hypothetical protein